MPSIQPAIAEPTSPATSLLVHRCPECDGPVVRASGCLCCQQCGWSRCG